MGAHIAACPMLRSYPQIHHEQSVEFNCMPKPAAQGLFKHNESIYNRILFLVKVSESITRLTYGCWLRSMHSRLAGPSHQTHRTSLRCTWIRKDESQMQGTCENTNDFFRPGEVFCQVCIPPGSHLGPSRDLRHMMKSEPQTTSPAINQSDSCASGLVSSWHCGALLATWRRHR